MNTRKLIIYEILFFVQFSVYSHFLRNYRTLKLLLISCLILWFTLYLYRYFAHSKTILKSTIISTFSLFVLFEITKSIEYMYGRLPRYDDVPFYISEIASLVAIFLYVGLVILSTRLWNGNTI